MGANARETNLWICAHPVLPANDFVTFICVARLSTLHLGQQSGKRVLAVVYWCGPGGGAAALKRRGIAVGCKMKRPRICVDV